MATKRSITNLSDFKFVFNGQLFMGNSTACVPDNWSDEQLSTLPEHLVLTVTQPTEATEEPVSAPTVDPDAPGQAETDNQPTEPVEPTTDDQDVEEEVTENEPPKRRRR